MVIPGGIKHPVNKAVEPCPFSASFVLFSPYFAFFQQKMTRTRLADPASH